MLSNESLDSYSDENIALIVISHHEAHIHQVNIEQGQLDSLDMENSEEIRNYLSKNTNRRSHYGDHSEEDQRFYRTVIDSVRDKSCIFVYGDGMGNSSSEQGLEESIRLAYPEHCGKFVFLEYSGHPTGKQLLTATQEAYNSLCY